MLMKIMMTCVAVGFVAVVADAIFRLREADRLRAQAEADAEDLGRLQDRIGWNLNSDGEKSSMQFLQAGRDV